MSITVPLSATDRAWKLETSDDLVMMVLMFSLHFQK